MKRAMHSIACIGLVAGISIAAQAYTTTTLDVVIKNHMTLTSGDKAFTDFGFLSADFIASQVTVQYGNDVIDKDGNFGICFQGAFTARAGEAPKDFGLKFNVTAIPSDRIITDAHLAITGSAHGKDSGVDVSETVIPSIGAALGLDAFINGDGTYQLTDAGFLGVPSKTVTVLKDVLLDPGTASNGRATVSLICQYFSQSASVPEPGTVAIFVGMGISGGLLVAKRRKK